MHAPSPSVDHFSNLPVPSFVPGNGAVFGSVRWALRLEAFAAFASATAIYGWNGFAWPIFAALFLAPDVAMLAYFAGPRAGALAYNLAHSAAFALAVTLAGFFCGSDLAVTLGLIWIAHIGIDRALGYGLKYPTGFHDTHFGRIGRR